MMFTRISTRLRRIASWLVALIVICPVAFSGTKAPIGQKRAFEIALSELQKRGIHLKPDWEIRIFEDVHIPELGADIPLYVVSVFDDKRSTKYPLYIIKLDRYTGKLDDFMTVDLRR